MSIAYTHYPDLDAQTQVKYRWRPEQWLAEMQLRIIWEEILARFSRVEVVAEPVRVASNFVKGYEELLVVVHSK